MLVIQFKAITCIFITFIANIMELKYQCTGDVSGEAIHAGFGSLPSVPLWLHTSRFFTPT